MKRLAIIGAGDLGKLLAHHARDFKLAGFFDDTLAVDTNVHGSKILGAISSIQRLYDADLFDELIIGIGYKHFAFREHLFNAFYQKIPFTNIIHPSTVMDSDVQLGAGVFILPGVTIDTGCKIGCNVLINTGSVIAHDTSIGDHSFIAPSVAIAGKIKIGNRCLLGINSTVIDHIEICDDVILGAGSLVLRNILVPGTYVGAPVKLKHS